MNTIQAPLQKCDCEKVVDNTFAPPSTKNKQPTDKNVHVQTDEYFRHVCTTIHIISSSATNKFSDEIQQNIKQGFLTSTWKPPCV